MVIVAKYPSTCACCKAPIAAGSKIEWSKGQPARHVGCAGSAAPVPARPARRANRDLSIARRNYAATGDYYGSGLYDEES